MKLGVITHVCHPLKKRFIFTVLFLITYTVLKMFFLLTCTCEHKIFEHRLYFFPSSPASPVSPISSLLLRRIPQLLPASIRPIRWRMEVPSLPESASIRPLNPPHRSFVLELDVLHLRCRAPGLPRRGAAFGLGAAGRAAADLDACSQAATGLGAVGLFPFSSGACSALGAAGLGASSSASPGGHDKCFFNLKI
jgi:hypothetical protein